MKKFFLFCMAALLLTCVAVSFTSCDQCTAPTGVQGVAIEYSLNAEGHADGTFGVGFPHGKFESKGDVELNFELNSFKTVLTRSAQGGEDLEDALESNDAEKAEAAKKVETELKGINITSLDGHYFVHIKGQAKEPVTGLVFVIDRTYTNIDSLKTN